MQQDAEECWSQIVSALKQKLKTPENEFFVTKYFELEFQNTCGAPPHPINCLV